MSYGRRSVQKRGGRMKSNYSESTNVRRNSNESENINFTGQIRQNPKTNSMFESSSISTLTSDFYDDQKTLYLLCKYYIGNFITIKTENEEYNGILKTIAPNGDFCLTETTVYRKNAEYINRNEKFKIIPIKDVKMVELKKSNYALEGEKLPTDEEIAKRNRALRDGQVENSGCTDTDLTPFYDSSAPSDDCLSMNKVGAHWFPPEEMFEKNKVNFNVQSTYSEDLKGYTTQLHKDDPNFEKEILLAQKKAEEIERDRERNYDHLENGDEDNVDEDDEELLYCSVVRNTNDSSIQSSSSSSSTTLAGPSSSKFQKSSSINSTTLNFTNKSHHYLSRHHNHHHHQQQHHHHHQHNLYGSSNSINSSSRSSSNQNIRIINPSSINASNLPTMLVPSSPTDQRHNLNPNALEFTPTSNSTSHTNTTNNPPTIINAPPQALALPPFINPYLTQQQYNDLMNSVNMQFTNITLGQQPSLIPLAPGPHPQQILHAPGPPPNFISPHYTPTFIPGPTPGTIMIPGPPHHTVINPASSFEQHILMAQQQQASQRIQQPQHSHIYPGPPLPHQITPFFFSPFIPAAQFQSQFDPQNIYQTNIPPHFMYQPQNIINPQLQHQQQQAQQQQQQQQQQQNQQDTSSFDQEIYEESNTLQNESLKDDSKINEIGDSKSPDSTKENFLEINSNIGPHDSSTTSTTVASSIPTSSISDSLSTAESNFYFQTQKMFYGGPPPGSLYITRPTGPAVPPQIMYHHHPHQLRPNNNPQASNTTAQHYLSQQTIGAPPQAPQSYQLKPLPTPNNFHSSLNQSFIPPPPQFQFISAAPPPQNKYSSQSQTTIPSLQQQQQQFFTNTQQQYLQQQTVNNATSTTTTINNNQIQSLNVNNSVNAQNNSVT